MAQPHSPHDKRPAPRLYLVTPAIEDAAAFAGTLRDALEAADIAAVLLRLKDAGERDLINRIKLLAPIVQDKDVALVLHGHADIAARAGADGAHLNGLAAFSAAVESLKPAKIAGCGGVNSRDDAMVAGEQGADYVMFGDVTAEQRRSPLDAIVERIEWWAQLFQIPCVGFAASLSEIRPLSAAGADFVAVGDGIWDDPRGAAAAIADAAGQLTLPEFAK
ncbi:MAG: thiamine phosphate synthase [Alphaproteobacteria bacterium]|nr:thiamine phosphate synthase [Alphaproteobacteria bacterium]